MSIEINSTIRDIFLIIDAIQFSIYLELVIFSLYRAFRKKNTIKVNGRWAIIFASFGSIEIFSLLNIYFDYYSGELGIRTVFILNSISTLAIVFLFEYFYKRYQDTKYIITFLGFIIAFLTSIFYTDIMLKIIGIYYILLFGFTIAFFKRLITISSGSLRISVIIFTLSFYSLMIGNFIKNDITIQNLSEYGFDVVSTGFFARGLKITSILLMSVVLFNLPIFLEVNWRDSLINIIIIHKEVSVSIANFEFQPQANNKNINNHISEELVAGGMIGITTMLKEISQSKEELKVLDHSDVKILLEYGKNIIIALSVKEEMHIYREMMIELKEKIEKIFGSVLEKWHGDMRVFDPLNSLISTIF